MRLNLHLLRLFMHVAETGSFSKAAELVCVSQPAVSKGVRELEHQLDIELFERGLGGHRQAGHQGVRLTEAGQALYHHAKSIFAIEQVALEDVRTRVGLQRGSLTLGASTTVASYWLPPYVAKFCQMQPGIVPRLRVGNTEWVAQQLLHYEVDFALVEGEVTDNAIVASVWREDEQVIVTYPDAAFAQRRIDARGLANQAWILREPGSGTRQSTERLCASLGIRLVPWMEMASNEAIARTVASGVGVSMLPRLVVADMLRLGHLREVRINGQTHLSRPLTLLRLKSRHPSPAAASMLDLLHSSDHRKPGVRQSLLAASQGFGQR